MKGPAIVLVEPQLGENIGACARAMLNCGLEDLRLVRPRDGWPNEKALSAATGASSRLVERARLFERTEDAVADLAPVLATTSRNRELLLPALGPQGAIDELRAAPRQGGLLFGPERTGLYNDDLVLAHAIVEIPLNPEFSSLNLAQAVLLLAYRWSEEVRGAPTTEHPPEELDEDLASAGELHNFYEHLEQELDAARFFRVPEKRAGMVQNLRAMFARTRLRRHEVRTLHGVVSALVGRRKDGAPVRRPGSKP